ncbi:MAG: flippase-like domain-containing protein [Rhodothermales bacterium]|nr:flippase-like domain-containing protein [Rhodothermales bacterium]
MTTLLVLIVRAVDSAAMRDAAQSASWDLVVPAFLLMPVQVCWGAALWRRLARAVDPQARFLESLRALLGSLAVSIWTPARAGDFAARPTLMPRGSRRTLAVAVAAENVLRLPVPLVIAAPAAMVVGFTAYGLFAGAAIAVALLAVGLIWAPGAATRIAGRFGAERHVEFLHGLSGGERLRLIGGHGARYLLLVAQFMLVALAMSGPAEVGLLPMAAACTVVLAAKLMAPLLNFAELGIREGASVVAFGAVGLSVEQALQASLLLYGMNVLVPAAVGAFYWLRSSRRDGQDPPAANA